MRLRTATKDHSSSGGGARPGDERRRVIGIRRPRVAPSLLLCLLAVAPGCVSAVDLEESTSPLVPGHYTAIGEAEGSSSGFSVFLMQFGSSDAIGSARDRALKDSGGDALVKVSADSRDFYFLFLFGFHSATVRGTAVRRSP